MKLLSIVQHQTRWVICTLLDCRRKEVVTRIRKRAGFSEPPRYWTKNLPTHSNIWLLPSVIKCTVNINSSNNSAGDHGYSLNPAPTGTDGNMIPGWLGSTLFLFISVASNYSNLYLLFSYVNTHSCSSIHRFHQTSITFCHCAVTWGWATVGVLSAW